MAEPVGMLLAKGRSLREERDRYRREIPAVVSALRAQGVSLSDIATATGIPRTTVDRIARTSGMSHGRRSTTRTGSR